MSITLTFENMDEMRAFVQSEADKMGKKVINVEVDRSSPNEIARDLWKTFEHYSQTKGSWRYVDGMDTAYILNILAKNIVEERKELPSSETMALVWHLNDRFSKEVAETIQLVD